MSEKLIYADKLIQFAENWGKHHGREEAADSFLYAIHKAPAVDAVEVVRCKDCNSYNGHRYCTYLDETVLDDDFCSYGERRE